jgi:ornithine cyclodeaminase/alanine dehydrogenase-like protein (mu-crystallin family)
MKVLVLSHTDVERLLPVSECIEVMSEALASLARGEVHQPLRTAMRPPGAPGVLGMMPSYRSGDHAAYGIKIVCVTPGNAEKGLDLHQGGVALFKSETGEFLSLMNASAITAIRTAAVSGLATRLLARKDSKVLAIIGAGVQARVHLAAMLAVAGISTVRVASRSIASSRRFAEEMGPLHSISIQPSESVETAVRGADIVVTATSASEPVVTRQWISPGAHLNVVGSSIRTTREVDSETMAASSLFVDRRESTLNEAGDYLFAAKDGAIGPDHIKGEIGELLAGTVLGRQSREEITLFKSLGLGIEDLASAQYLYRKAKDTGQGSWVDF